MFFKRRNRLSQPIAGRAHFEANTVFCEVFHELGIVDAGDSVANSFSAEQLDGFPNILWTDCFTCMDGYSCAPRFGFLKRLLENPTRKVGFIASEVESNQAV